MHNASAFEIAQVYLILYKSTNTRLPQPHQVCPDRASIYIEPHCINTGKPFCDEGSLKGKDKWVINF